MPNYAYRGRSRSGELVTGSLEAASAAAAAERLGQDGIIPLAVEEQRMARPGPRLQFGGGKLDLPELIMFSRQMYTLARAGVPILRALAGLAESTDNTRFANILRELGAALASGQDLATALSQHKRVFNDFYISMVHVGENTGRLDEAFLQLAGHLERELETRKRITAALRYPSFVILAIAAAITVINLLVIPAFRKVFESFRTELPLPTRILIATSDFFVHYWWLLLLMIVAAVVGWLRFTATEFGRLWWDRRKLSLPVVGDIIHRALLGRFARSFATLARSGVALPTGLIVVARVVDNAYVGQKIVGMRDGIERGETITRNAAATGLFSPLVLQMLAVGEETGALDDLLDEVADFYDREVDYDLKRLADRIEPIMLVAVGILVLILALGVFLPMWDLTKLARGGG